MTRLIPALLVAVLGAAALMPWAPWAVGTPTYAARAGRTCDNCHLDPSTWENPEWKQRKCTLSCQGCHVDPAGGGLRTVSGRFYGAATLPAVATEHRPTQDWDKDWFGLFHRMDTKTTYTHDIPRGPAVRAKAVEYAPSDRWAWGRHDHDGGWTQGRYGDLNADPVLRLGWDIRSALLIAPTHYENTEVKLFPMQFDVGALLHPVHHVKILANVGARGRASGLSETVDDARTPYLRDAFVLLTEFPYQAYAKAGRFAPSYGLRLDDHTAFIRRRTGLDTSVPDSRVWGVEVGAAANYPFFNLSWFQSKAEGVAPEAWEPWDADDAWGVALNAGYRDLAWALGASVLHRGDYVDQARRLQAVGAYGVWNLWAVNRGLPLTYQVEVDRVARELPSGEDQIAHVFWQELTWSATNGLNLLLGHSWEDPDRDLGYDEFHRVHLGAQVTPYPGVTLDLRLRRLWARRHPNFDAFGDPPSPHGTDLFFQLHLWN